MTASGDLGRVHRDLRPYVRAARRAGWRTTPARNGGGLLLWPPDGGRPIPVHGSPNVNGRAGENFRAKMRRHGIAP